MEHIGDLTRRRVLLVGDPGIRRVLQRKKVDAVVHYYDSLIDLVYDQPKDMYDAAIVGYRDCDKESVEAVRYLSMFFRKMPIFVVKVRSRGQDKVMRYQKGLGFTYLHSTDAAIELITDYQPEALSA